MKNKGKNLWLINHYASTPESGMGGRHYYLAKELVKQGHNVYLIAGSYTHLLNNPQKFRHKFKQESVEGINFVWVRMPSYKDAHSAKRVINWIRFAWSIKGLINFIPDSPDAILYSSPSLVGYLGAEKLAKHYKVPLTFEVRDIWPMTLCQVGGYSSSNLFIKFLQWIEDRAYRNADKVISNLKNSVEHMVCRGMNKNKFTWIPNGFSVDEVCDPHPLKKETLENFPSNKFVVGYTGTIGVANALKSFVEAASILKGNEDIAFVIVGAGKEKINLSNLVQERSLKNFTFIDPIEKTQVQSILKKFDACFIGLTDSPLFTFGVSPNKLFDYLYSARPIIYAIDSGNYNPVTSANCGFQVEPENPEEIARAILEIYNMDDAKRFELGMNGHKAALEQHEYGMLAKKLSNAMLEGGK